MSALPDPKVSTATTDTPPPKALHPAALEEDDEFEDFPIDDWPPSENEVPAPPAPSSSSAAAESAPTTTTTTTTHLWEESWDDDDTSEDFSRVLKSELEKVKGGK